MQGNLQIGDIVHVMDNNYIAGYKIARITQVYPGKDGLVRRAKVSTAQRYEQIVSVHIVRLIVPQKL